MIGFVVGAGAAPPAEPRSWVLPPIDGTLSGEFTPTLLPGAPPLKWKITLETRRPRERTVACEVEGRGLKVRAGAVLDPQGEGTWDLTEAVVDLEEWFGRVADRFAPEASTAVVSGTLQVRGAGRWQGGVLGGRAEVALRDGRLEEPGQKMLVEGIALQLEIDDLAARRSPAAQVLTWQGGKYDTLPFGAGRVEFALEGDTVRIARSSLTLLGGELRTGAMELTTAQKAVAVTALARGIDLQQVLFLLPPTVSAAQGKLDGRIALQFGADGLQIGRGRLGLRPGEKADLRLKPSPGLLSASLPATVIKHYPGLAVMETGGVPLRADLLEITLTPAGDQEGRSASVRIEGGPADPALKAPVVLQMNVRGPLESIIKFGTNSRLRFGEGP